MAKNSFHAYQRCWCTRFTIKTRDENSHRFQPHPVHPHQTRDTWTNAPAGGRRRVPVMLTRCCCTWIHSLSGTAGTRSPAPRTRSFACAIDTHTHTHTRASSLPLTSSNVPRQFVGRLSTRAPRPSSRSLTAVATAAAAAALHQSCSDGWRMGSHVCCLRHTTSFAQDTNHIY